jgi:hypothetical protein
MADERDTGVGRTWAAVNRLREKGVWRPPDREGPYGYYGTDPIIGSKSPRISGGVYPGGAPREAITLKPDEDPRIVDVFDILLQRIVLRKMIGKIDFNQTESDMQKLSLVNSTVRRVIPYDAHTARIFSYPYSDDKKISIGEYIERGFGVCRHQGALAALLTEYLNDLEKLPGKVRLERNDIPDVDGGVHAWAVYVRADGREYAVDPTHDFVGPKAEAERMLGISGYYVPSDDI